MEKMVYELVTSCRICTKKKECGRSIVLNNEKRYCQNCLDNTRVRFTLYKIIREHESPDIPR